MIEQMSEPKITPLARRLAEENGIDWRRIEGTGPQGEITERDILNFLAKVMAGEITLEGPPPGEPPPPEGEADLEAARAALEKEGVPLDELIPKEKPAADELTTEFELELDLLEEEEEAPAAEAEAWEEEEAVKDITAELPIYQEESVDETAKTDEVEIFHEEELPEEAPPADITTELPVYHEEIEEEFEEPAAEAEEAVAEAAPVPEPEPTPTPEPEPAAEPTPAPAAAAAVGAAAAAAETPAPAPEPAGPTRIWYRPLPLSALDALLEDFGAELGRKLPRAALLYLAARRALADLEVPLRPLKERYQVPQAENFAGFLAAWERAEEEGEGLSVVESEPPLELTAPALALATQGLPEGEGLLILVGELPTSEEKFLERVAHYLEKPIRLLLFG